MIINRFTILAILLIALNTSTVLAGYVREHCVICDDYDDAVRVENAINEKNVDALNEILKKKKCFILDKNYEAEFFQSPNLKYHPSKIIIYDKYVQAMPHPEINSPKRGECSKVFYLSRFGVLGFDKKAFKSNYYYGKSKRRNCGFDDGSITVTTIIDILRTYISEDN